MNTALEVTEIPSLGILQASLTEWQRFEQFYAHILRENIGRGQWLLHKLSGFLLRRSGKKVRPLLLLYTAKACGQVTEASFIGAALIEILHNATLIHDDVVDKSDYRRGFFSLRALWGNRVAVLFGDWLLAQGLLLSLEHKAYKLLHYTSEAVQALAEGELLQLKKMREASVSLESYFEIIEKKTAALFQAACAMGAWTAESAEEVIHTAAEMGKKIGIAFQLRDDLLDWGDSSITGKPSDADRRQKRFTLPLLWALNQAKSQERHYLLHAPFQEVRNRLHDMGAFEYAESQLGTYVEEAKYLAQQLPHAKEVPLLQLLHVLTYRSK
ncbi:MAG: polyprenyl synthetase family protein [Bacteroidia bacterium]|nr:polyprenyl synthetase family protein [Bacteroidia bacterium]MDW8133543.1 polyprenyl synthetase family protein [Bacteroidia bacterium]